MSSAAATSALLRAHGVADTHPRSSTIAPHPAMIHQIGCVASVKLDPLVRLAFTTVPAIATPSAAPTCRPVEAIAAATPACAKGIPATALFVIAGFTIPNPRPNKA